MIDPTDAEAMALARSTAGRWETLRDRLHDLRVELAYALRDLADRLDPPPPSPVIDRPGLYAVTGSVYGAGGMPPGSGHLVQGGQIIVHASDPQRAIDEALGGGRVMGYREGLEDGRRGR